MQNYQRGNIALQKEQALLQPQIEQGQAESELAKTNAVGAQFRLQGEQATTGLNVAAGLLQDPRIQKSDPDGTVAALTEARDTMMAKGVPKNTAEFLTSQLMSKSHQPGAVANLLQNVIRANAGPGTQASVINAPVSLVTTPSGAVAPVQLQPGAPGALKPVPISSLQPQSAAPAPADGVIPAGIPPSQVQTPTTDVLGRPAIASKDQRGNISYQAPEGANYRPMMAFPPGENANTIPELQSIRAKAQSAAANAPAQHFNNDRILKLSPDAFTGTGGGQLAKVLNTYGLQSTNNAGADTAQLQHFIALQTQEAAANMGANTNEARQLAAQSVLPSDSPEKAIKAITKVNDAYVTGNELFNNGIQSTLRNPSNQKDIFAVRDFQNAWSQNFDPRIMQLENAAKAGDKDEIAKIKAQLGPQGIVELQTKAKNLQRLVSQGAANGP